MPNDIDNFNACFDDLKKTLPANINIGLFINKHYKPLNIYFTICNTPETYEEIKFDGYVKFIKKILN